MTSSTNKPPVTVERRRHERISTNLEAALRIGLVMENGTVHAAVPMDISTAGVCLRWPPGDATVLNVGQRVTLRMQLATADEWVTVQAVVRWTGVDEDENIRCGMEFEDLFKIFEDVMPTLWELCHTLHDRR